MRMRRPAGDNKKADRHRRPARIEIVLDYCLRLGLRRFARLRRVGRRLRRRGLRRQFRHRGRGRDLRLPFGARSAPAWAGPAYPPPAPNRSAAAPAFPRSSALPHAAASAGPRAAPFSALAPPAPCPELARSGLRRLRRCGLRRYGRLRRHRALQGGRWCACQRHDLARRRFHRVRFIGIGADRTDQRNDGHRADDLVAVLAFDILGSFESAQIAHLCSPGKISVVLSHRQRGHTRRVAGR